MNPGGGDNPLAMPKIRIYLSEDNQTVHDLTDEKVTVGRLPDNSLQIEDDSVSSHHAELTLENGEYHLQDLGSTNGTFVNGEAATAVILKAGDQVRFGKIDCVMVGEELASGSQPLPDSGRVEASLGAGSSRPATFVNASPFPKPSEKPGALTYVATALAALGALAFFAAVMLTMTIEPPI